MATVLTSALSGMINIMKKGGFFKKTVRDVPIAGKTVLVRADYNVPLGTDGTIADDLRIRASLPTLRYLIEKKCRVVITSHLGRPDGKPDTALSLEPVAERLTQLLKKRVEFVDDCVGDKVIQAVKHMGAGQVVLLENVRFYPDEEKNSAVFARRIAQDTKAQYFVQDGFGVVHRAHASTDAITRYVPSVAGLLLEREVETITRVMKNPKKPFTAIVGGAKIADKIEVIERFIEIADTIIIGGAMANTFLHYKGLPIGKSKFEAHEEDVVKGIYERAVAKVKTVDDFIVLPIDVAVAKTIADDAPRQVVDTTRVADDDIILDIGTKSIAIATDVIAKSQTVVWNGTVGYAELSQFAHGSARIAMALASHPDITSVIGGGDTADFVLDWDGNGGTGFSHVSTGGGASLELMSGKKLPGVEALLDV